MAEEGKAEEGEVEGGKAEESRVEEVEGVGAEVEEGRVNEGKVEEVEAEVEDRFTGSTASCLAILFGRDENSSSLIRFAERCAIAPQTVPLISSNSLSIPGHLCRSI